MRRLYEPYPTVVDTPEGSFKVCTDFRDWLRFSDMLSDKELSNEEKAAIALQYFISDTPGDYQTCLTALCAFFANKEYSEMEKLFNGPKTTKKGRATKQFDFAIDAEAITAGFYATYGIDLEKVPYLHWHKFRTLLLSLPEDTEFKQRVKVRGINLASIKDASEKTRIKKIQLEIAIPMEAPSDEDIAEFFW